MPYFNVQKDRPAAKEETQNSQPGVFIILAAAEILDGDTIRLEKGLVLWQKLKYEAELEQAEEDAKSRNLGLWAAAP